MKPLVSFAAALAVLATGSVGSAGPPRVVPYEPQQEARRCPEVMRGVDLVIRPIAGGVEIELTTPRRQQVAELRQQLREAALVVERHSKAPLRVAAIDPEQQQARIPPLDISVKDVGAGARVTIRAQRARDVPELLELAAALELIWESSDCNEEIGLRRRLMVLPSQRA